MVDHGPTPQKLINDGDDLSFFHTSLAYRDIKLFLAQLNRACFPIQDGSDTSTLSTCTLDNPPPYSEPILALRALLTAYTDLLTDAPPDTGPRRFGNVAFRRWYQLAEARTPELLEKHLPSSTHARLNELSAYLLGSFGSAQRLDYGTGHELSFLAFLGCLSKLSLFPAGSERSLVIGVIFPYLELVRKLILTYTLEPAGSHGVWGLDDHSFLPYIFGSAQLGPTITSPTSPTPLTGSLPTAPSPESVTDKSVVREHSTSNLYFGAVNFIHAVKRGPFWEHSPILFNISGIKDGWGKINKGMLKMYDAEVLGKFPVVQHFVLGEFFRWERDPDVIVEGGGSVHVQQQPSAKGRSGLGGSGGGGSVGTQAPWTKQGASQACQGQAATGMPSTRAPWAGGGGEAGMSAPWASGPSARMPPPGGSSRNPAPASGANGRVPAPGMAPTAAPWKRTG